MKNWLFVLLTLMMLTLTACSQPQTMNDVTGNAVASDALSSQEDEECATCDQVELTEDQEEVESEEELELVMEAVVDEEPKGDVVEFSEEDFSADDATVLTVSETDEVKLDLDAKDPDGDELFYEFSWPFDENGAWETHNGDAGEYAVTVTVSDGEYTVTKNVLVVVEEVNFPPRVLTLSHEYKYLTLAEGDTLEMSVDAMDPDDDEVSFAWILDTTAVGAESELELDLDFDTAGEHNLQLILSDGEDETTLRWVLVVENTNRAPTLDVFTNHEITETDPLTLDVTTDDPDGDELTVTFAEPFDENGFWQTDYESAGGYAAPVTVSDGDLSVTEVVKVIVRDKNRAPRIASIDDLEVAEATLLALDLDVSDPDGDELTVTIDEPVGDDGVWETTHDDAGVYLVNVTADDGSAQTSAQFKLTVENVNRAPVIAELDNVVVLEDEQVTIDVVADDPDGDEVSVSFSDPLDESGSWTPDFDSAGEYLVTVTATDGDLSTTATVTLTVENKNRPPQIFGVSTE